jgi:hypothetical protein
MNKWNIIMLLASIISILSGCVSTTNEIARWSSGARTGVFVETPAGGTPPAGFVDLVVSAAIKIPSSSSQEIQEYPVLLNIDGQAVRWSVNGQRESLPLYDKDGYPSRNPDAGDGMKYRLEKRIRLATGLHKIVFALPNEDYLSEFKIRLSEGETWVLEFKPHYRFAAHPRRMPVFRTTFLQGIERYDAVLNGREVRPVVASIGSYGFKAFLPAF